MSDRLAGCAILVVEDEPIIALDIADAFTCAGARTVMSRSLREAHQLVQGDSWSAAVLDHLFEDGDSSQLCELLAKRNVPFVLYTGRGELDGACGSGVHVLKPANPEVLVRLVEDLILPPRADE
jgi:DNA-binding NtrC family response regulator